MRIDDDLSAARVDCGDLSRFAGKVALAMPLGRYGPHPRTFHDWNEMLLYTASQVPDIEVYGAWDGFTPGMRQALAQGLLDSRREWLFWVDSDMTFDADIVCRLLQRVAQNPHMLMLSGTARMRMGKQVPVLYRREADNTLSTIHTWGIEPFTVDAVGAFGSLIHRRIFETVPPPWFAYVPPGYGDGDDIGFCKRVRDVGIEIWIDPACSFGHIGERIVPGAPGRFE